MNLTDIFIIYLACGAPFGVYYFFQNRNRMSFGPLVLQTIVRFILWIVFVLPLVARRTLFTKLYRVGFDGSSDLDSRRATDLSELRKAFENLPGLKTGGVAVFEFREVYDRFTGLSDELSVKEEDQTESEFEIFRISGHTNRSLGAECLRRRNRERLEHHQKLARRDFLEFVSSQDLAAGDLIARLGNVLNDIALPTDYGQMLKSAGKTQSKIVEDVNGAGKELWKADQPKQFHEPMISTNLQLMTAKPSLSERD